MPTYTTTNNPAWVSGLKFGYAYDGSTRYLAVLVSAPPQSVTLESAINQSGASGHWSNGTFYLMEPTTQYADSGYACRTHYFPTNPGVDGVRPEAVTITLRKQNTQETLTVTITPQSTVGLPPNQIVLDGGTTTQPPTPPPPTTTTNYGSPVGHLDYPNAAQATESPRPTSLAGWAADRNQRNVAIPVDIFVDNTKVATITATGNRPDVGTSIGDNGLHGYWWEIPAQYRSGARTFAVRYGGNATQLTNSPRTIDFGGTAPPPPPPTGTPPWAQGFDSAYTYDNGSRNFTVYATSNATNIEVAVNQPGASGAGWTSGQFYTLPQQSGNGYTHRRDFNPSSPGQGGISNTGLRLAFRIDGGNGADGVQTNSFTPVSTAALYRPGPITFYPLRPVAPSVGPQTATKGQSYSFTVPAFTDDPFNFPLTYTASGLPDGLSFDNGSRVISGTPTRDGSFNVSITARNRFGRTAILTIGFTVNPAGTQPPVTPPTGPLAGVGYRTNPNLLNLEAFDTGDGGFWLQNSSPLPAPPTNLAWWYFIGSEQRGYPASAFNNTLRFPKNVPILVEVWTINPNESKGPDYYRNEGPDRYHAEQLLIVY